MHLLNSEIIQTSKDLSVLISLQNFVVPIWAQDKKLEGRGWWHKATNFYNMAQPKIEERGVNNLKL